jgi:hypothetical protein
VLVGFEREHGQPKPARVRWAGAGRYLREVSVNDIVEFVE